MGFTDEDFFKVKNALMETFYNGKDRANSQLYAALTGTEVSSLPASRNLFGQLTRMTV